jgi:non-heme chloroperoxidase
MKKGITPQTGFLVLILFCSLFISSCRSGSGNGELKSVHFQGVEIHYKIDGVGEPIILIHGSVVDLRYWKEQVSVLSKHFQVITYSRRYNYPNDNEMQPNHSAIVEARDLLGLMDELNIQKAYILGHSYGAYTALLFAIEHPERINKLILAEPPLERWLPDLPNGQGKLERFMTNTWIPIGKAFTEKGDRAGLEITAERFFHMPLDSVPEYWRNFMFQNVREWHALATSADAYPKIDYSKIQNLKIPTLLISGQQNAGTSNDLIDMQLAKLLPDSKRIIIENAGHEMFVENAKPSNQAVLDFLR